MLVGRGEGDENANISGCWSPEVWGDAKYGATQSTRQKYSRTSTFCQTVEEDKGRLQCSQKPPSLM